MIMDALINKINELKKSEVKKQVDKKLASFKVRHDKGNDAWFCELCFCILTANTSAELGLRVQRELGYAGFTGCSSEAELAKRLRDARYRFYNRRAHFIFLATRFRNIKDILVKDILEQGNIKMQALKTQEDKREWLVRNIKGIGYKEASHFLRNTGYFNLAILDKHILSLLEQYRIIDKRPKTMSRKNYLEIEQSFKNLASTLNMLPAELDLYMWSMKTGRVVK